MSLARMSKDEDLGDKVLYNQIADMFMFFLPGLSSTFAEIAVSDAKTGHALLTVKIPQLSSFFCSN